LRVLYFTRDYTPHDHRFLSALAESPHTIYSLRMEQRGRQLEDRPLPVEVTQMPWAGGQRPARWSDYPRLVRDLRRVLKEVQPDVVHAGSIQTAAFLTALAGFQPLVSMSWGSDLLKEADQSAWMRWVTRYTLARTTVLAADCDVVRQKAASFGFPPERAVLFPWGVDLQTFSPCPGEGSGGLRARQGWEQAFVALSLRSWEPLYGVDVLVRGFASAARQEPRLRLILLGGGSQAKLLREIVNEQGVMDQVFFGGQATNHQLPDYYRTADLYISASHSDGSSVSLMEALACGTPLIASAVGGLAQVVNEEVGRLVTPEDPIALA
jgi:glycosyltransferase involved in cell wall biosynthesis